LEQKALLFINYLTCGQGVEEETLEMNVFVDLAAAKGLLWAGSVSWNRVQQLRSANLTQGAISSFGSHFSARSSFISEDFLAGLTCILLNVLTRSELFLPASRLNLSKTTTFISACCTCE